jgi:hypothetical protein
MTSGSKRVDPLPTFSSLLGEKRSRVSDAFSFLNNVGDKGEGGGDARCVTSDTISSDIDNAGGNLSGEERRRVSAFNRELKLHHQRHQGDVMALFNNTAINTKFIKNYVVEEWLCESVVVLRQHDTHLLLNLKGMHRHKKDLDTGRMGDLEYVREGIEEGRGIEYMGRLLEENVYASRTFRFV